MVAYSGPDEYPIGQIPGERLWSENFAACYGCAKSQTGVIYSAGRWHSDPQLWRESMIFTLPNGEVVFYRGYGRQSDPKAVGSGVTLYEIIEPGRTTRLRFDGPMMKSTVKDLIENGSRVGPASRCKMDLTFEYAAPVWHMSGSSHEAQTVAGSMHIDHIGKVNGTIEFQGQRYQMSNAYGVRDHSRGVRDMAQYGGHNWLNGVFPSGRAFYVYAMKGPNGSIGMSNAAVVLDDRLYPAKLIETQFVGSTTDWGQAHPLKLQSELGEMVVSFTKTLSTLPVGLINPFDVCAGTSMDQKVTMEFDEPMFLSCDGETGFGWSERGFSEGYT